MIILKAWLFIYNDYFQQETLDNVNRLTIDGAILIELERGR